MEQPDVNDHSKKDVKRYLRMIHKIGQWIKGQMDGHSLTETLLAWNVFFFDL